MMTFELQKVILLKQRILQQQSYGICRVTCAVLKPRPSRIGAEALEDDGLFFHSIYIRSKIIKLVSEIDGQIDFILFSKLNVGCIKSSLSISRVEAAVLRYFHSLPMFK